ncbi:MAG: Holliday junction resolvase RuvX [Kiritimatiellota bacterium]|nr:Holliday junction resolvase RuvX [Kiritimatiellota bacterium]
MPRYLGVDYGERRVGLAISDELGMMALPLDILPVQGTKQVIRDVLRLCQEKQVAVIVVGLPLNMDGSRGPAVEAVERFVLQLRRQAGWPVEVWDERMSSRQVERMLIDADVSRSKRKGLVDKLAAQVILQSYLDAHSKTTENPGVPAGDVSI